MNRNDNDRFESGPSMTHIVADQVTGLEFSDSSSKHHQFQEEENTIPLIKTEEFSRLVELDEENPGVEKSERSIFIDRLGNTIGQIYSNHHSFLERAKIFKAFATPPYKNRYHEKHLDIKMANYYTT